MAKNFKNYYQTVQYLESFSRLPQADYFVKKSGRKIFLQRLKYFLNLIGEPQKEFQYIHIGGTSGKGSVAAMIHSILTAAGHNAGLFTSPFCTTSIEKIKVGNFFIRPEEFVKIVESLKPAIDLCYQRSPYGRPSYFEIFVAIALLYFKQKKCDYVVLEVGLGGRYDATNIIPPAKITIINLIDYDHTEILGATLSQIAKEKAAIIKPKTTFFTPKQNPRVLKILQNACKRNRAQFNLVSGLNEPYQLGLLGEHQQNNAALAAAACEKLGINKNQIKAGLKKVKMPCRLEIIKQKPLVILDGAHNLSKLKTTAAYLRNLTYDKLYLIIALTSERDPKEIFAQIKSLADYILVTRYLGNGKRCYPPKELAKKLNTKKPVEIFLDPKQALNQALTLAKQNDLILVTGSFYLAGELRQCWVPEEKILKNLKS